MSDACRHDPGHDHPGHGHHDHPVDATTPGIRRVLWIALVVNAAMFVVELVGGFGADSVSLLADAVDFLGDAASYGLSLAVLGLALHWRARVAWWKGLTMLAWGAAVLAAAGWKAWQGSAPEPLAMGAIGTLALLANLAVAALLYRFRNGDANLRSVWLCSRNDALSNLAVMAAALGVFGSGTAWPDLAVAAIMGGLALTAGTAVIRQARAELRPA
jgi:Co/Zn/Cd efflux system component